MVIEFAASGNLCYTTIMRAFNVSRVPKFIMPESLRSVVNGPALELEIGAGQGLHAVTYSLRNPKKNLIAVERTENRFEQLFRRYVDHGRPANLFPVHADAISLVSHWIHDNSLDRVFLLYPNPYPKAKQANLRWHNMPFTSLLLRKMKPGAQLVMATNILSYKDEAISVLRNTWGLPLVYADTVTRDAAPRTHFEKKYLERGETCWNLVFENAAKAHTLSG